MALFVCTAGCPCGPGSPLLLSWPREPRAGWQPDGHGTLGLLLPPEKSPPRVQPFCWRLVKLLPTELSPQVVYPPLVAHTQNLSTRFWH